MLKKILSLSYPLINTHRSISSTLGFGNVINGNALAKEIKTLIKKEADVCAKRTLNNIS